MNIESNVVFFPCINLAETVNFYSAIGLSVHKDMGNVVIMDSGKGFLGFCKYDDSRPMATGVCISFNMADTKAVDGKYRQLTEMGIKTEGEAQKHSAFPVYSFFLSDPNGYTVEFQKILA